MTPSDTLSALLAAVVWGVTFVFIKLGVAEAPPMLLTALRFAFAAFPVLLFVRPPRAPMGKIAAYGFLIGVGQFGLLFLAFGFGMPVGLASVVVQIQAFFTILFAWIFMGERPTSVQGIATAITFVGIFTIGAARLGQTAFLPFALTVMAAACWASGNIVGKTAGRIDPLALTVWSSLVAPLPMAALSFYFEPERTLRALTHPTWMLAGCVAVLAYGGTLLGFGIWSRLLMRYPAAMVAPFALLVPVVGMLAGRLIFAEPLSVIELAGALLVMAGLSFNVLGERLRAYRRA